MDAQWSDDFHHALHVLLTGEQTRLLRGLHGHRGPRAGLSARASSIPASTRRTGSGGMATGAMPAPGWQLRRLRQNHDQVGNRATGDRLSQIIPYEVLKLAAAAVILSPFVPLLFMGEEYGEPAPFQYFTSHGDPALIAAVRRGGARSSPPSAGRARCRTRTTPRPSHAPTDSPRGGRQPHRTLWEFYQELFRLRRTMPALASLDLERIAVAADEATQVLTVRRWAGESQTLDPLQLQRPRAELSQPPARAILPRGHPHAEPPETGGGRGWVTLLDSADPRWRGPGSSDPVYWQRKIPRRSSSNRGASRSLAIDKGKPGLI